MIKKLAAALAYILFVLIFVLVTVYCLLYGTIEAAASDHVAGINNEWLHLIPPEVPEETTAEVTEPAQEWEYIGKFEITFYCACVKCTNSGDGVTATGEPVTAHRTIAVDPSVIPYYSEVKIDGLDYVYQATDTGGGMRGNRIDVYVTDHDTALWYGRMREVDVWVLKER